jgi:hypothetical protein
LESLIQYKPLIPYLAYLAVLVISGVALWKGDRPLQLAAMVLIVSWALTPLVSLGSKTRLDYPVMVIDTNAALGLVWISMRWRRIWCVVLAALMIVTVIMPIVCLVDRSIHKYNYYAATNAVAWLQLLVFVVAICLTVRARRRADEGPVRS